MTLYKITNIIKNEIKKKICFKDFRFFSTQKLDPIQEIALDQEQCILVDGNDKIVGSAPKRLCHIVNDDGGIPLHRAFSVFLFNTKGDILLQKRGKKKVTFPNVFTNACCSHPLWMGNTEENILSAACRKLNHELGIPLKEISPTDITYLTRVHYHHVGDGIWGEHEIDYMLFLQKDVTLNPNPEEIDEILFIPKNNFFETVSKLDAPLSPWFKLVVNHRLMFWWNNLHQLHLCQDQDKIHRFI